MTPEMEKNMTFVKDSIAKVGFGRQYDKDVDAGILSGKPEIALEPAQKIYTDKEVMVWELKVKEGNNPGRYMFRGFQATLYREGKEPVSQFIQNFKTGGMTAEQSRMALLGSTVLNLQWADHAQKVIPAYSRIAFEQPTNEGGNHPIIRVWAKNVDLALLVGKEDIMGNREQKDQILKDLQAGERIPVKIREKVNNVEQRTTVYLQLNLGDKEVMSMRVTDENGTLLREPKVPIKQQVELTQGLTVGQDLSSKLSPEMAKLIKKSKDHGAGKSPEGSGKVTPINSEKDKGQRGRNSLRA